MRVSEIGLGTEWLIEQPRETVVSVIEEAITNGINYFDLIFNIPEYLGKIAEGITEQREEIHLAVHLGSGYQDKQYRKTRNPEECEHLFNQTLKTLGTDYADVVNLHFVLDESEWKEVMTGGVYGIALRIKEEGKARHIGLSTHDTSVAAKAAENPEIKVIMIPVNLAEHSMPGRDDMFTAFVKARVGAVAMKPFWGGGLLQKDRITRMVQSWPGEEKFCEHKMPSVITPVHCLSYVLSQPVSTVVPGVKNLTELHEALAYVETSEKERDCSDLLELFRFYQIGECVYCNHCLPCPADIDIGAVNRLRDLAVTGATPKLQNQYSQLEAKASDCIECFQCYERCPYILDIIKGMKQAAALFEP